MKIRVLGASGSELPGHNLPAFLIDDTILMDAGTIGLALNSTDQLKISHIFLTHAHLDHVKGVPFLLDNTTLTRSRTSVTLISGEDVLRDIKNNLLNGRLWPDFTKIPDSRNPALRFKTIHPSRPFRLNGCRIYCERVAHSVPAYGYIVERGRKALAYTGDTGPTTLFWKKVSKHHIGCLIAEVSFPNSLTDLAVKSGHLTPALLKEEIAKIDTVPPMIYATHTKPQYFKEIKGELQACGIKNIEILKDGQVVTI
jgi:ribonuclease BN (tRNA processing enzyme)